MNNKLQIRNSTAEFLIFTKQAGEENVDVMLSEDNVWLTQTMIAKLYDKGRTTIVEHLKEIYQSGELDEMATCRNFRQVQIEGNREIERDRPYYNLEAIIAVGYRVNSPRATQFRKWATSVLKHFAIKGYVLDKERMKNGAFFSEDYFEHLLEDIREIRLSERRFYQKITDIYATAMDYDSASAITRTFFASVQNKLHFAIHGHTAAEIIVERADADREFMGITTWEKAPKGKIRKSDVIIAKNYLDKDEMEGLERIVSAYLEFAEMQAKRKIPMTMEDWAKRLNIFIQASDYEILNNAGSITAEIAKFHAETEFEKYRIVQDRLFESDFDMAMKQLDCSKR